MARDQQRTVWELVNRLLQGNLDERLRRWQSAKLSSRSMADLLSDEIGVLLAHDTIRRWLRELDDENGQAA